MAEGTIEVNGVELCTESFGDPSDPAILLMTGVSASMLWWEEGFLHASEVRIAALFALGYGLLELVEGTGLWLDQLWAEYLTVIATSLLIPFELYDLVHHPSALKAGGLVVNLAIVGYLVHLLRRRRHGSSVAAS